MATGKQAFTGSTSGVIFHAILAESPRPAGELNAQVPPELVHIIARALEKDRDARYQSAAELRGDLLQWKRAMESGNAATLAGMPGISPAASAAPRAPGAASRTNRRAGGLAASAVILLAVAAVVAWHFVVLKKAHALNATDTVVLADFANSTGDPVFDDTLKQALAISLRQSPFLELLPDSNVTATLKLMTKPPDTKLTPEAAREVCQRAGCKAYIAGSIASLGNDYVIGLKTVNCQSGGVMAQELVQVDGKEKVLNALSSAASKLRADVGESLSTVNAFDVPLVQATTPSLEALQAYTLGQSTSSIKGDDAAAVPILQRAIRLDPNFAMAYVLLGSSYFNLGETALAAENTAKAYELRAKVSERERLSIEAQYFDLVTGDQEKARQAYELWAQTYPREGLPHINLSAIYDGLGLYEKSLDEAREALRLSPAKFSIYGNLVGAYLRLNRLDEALAAAEEAQAKKLDSQYLSFYLYQLAFLKGDAAGMAQQVAWSAGKAGAEDVLLWFEADTAAYFGRLGKARELSRQAVASAQRADEKETAAGYEAEAALREVLFGHSAESRQRAAAALALSTARDVQSAAALALALSGDSARAQELADDLNKRFPKDTLVQFNYLPTIHAQLALLRNDSSKAIEALQAASPYELGNAGNGSALYPVYVRGQAFLSAHQGREAAAEFQKILGHRGVVINEPIGALAHLQLARANALQAASAAGADAAAASAKARSAYSDFFALWKDADADIPVLQQARTEYRSLP
jgi:Flp pilus assembly protein TadD